LCVLDHGDGPGAGWARSLRKGDEVLLRKPEGTFVASESAPYHVFAGEETASVAFGAMLRALPAGARVYGAIEVAGEGDRLPLPRTAELTWRFRGDIPAASSAGLVGAVRVLDLPTGPGVAYLAGEAAPARPCAPTWSPNAAGRAARCWSSRSGHRESAGWSNLRRPASCPSHESCPSYKSRPSHVSR